MADAINDFETCTEPSVTLVARGPFWSIHRQNDKWRFDIWSEDEKTHRCVPLKRADDVDAATARGVLGKLKSDTDHNPRLTAGFDGISVVLGWLAGRNG